MKLKVLIAGGGIGGLCLAQGLCKAGIAVEVFERDVSVQARGQGYRFRVDDQGDAALATCLPENLYTLYQKTSNQPSLPPVGAFDYQLNLIYRIPHKENAALLPHKAVNRLTLREVLLGELTDTVHFDHTLIDFEQTDQKVTARFANGHMAEGDVLVAADGVNSMIRQRLLPQATVVDTGMRAVYGRTLLTLELLAELPEVLHGGFVPVLGPERCTLALGMFHPCSSFTELTAELAPGVRLTPVAPYLMWIFVAPARIYDDARTQTLHNFVSDRLTDWHPALRQIIQIADADSTFPVTIRTSQRIAPWSTSRITFLGDAIHTMTPAGGIGANTAMRDAALLTHCLTGVDDIQSLIAAIANYEMSMREYGFAAVEHSLASATHLYQMTPPQPEIQT